jgi:hypothetical protein
MPAQAVDHIQHGFCLAEVKLTHGWRHQLLSMQRIGWRTSGRFRLAWVLSVAPILLSSFTWSVYILVQSIKLNRTEM